MKLKDCVSVVLADTEDTWRELFKAGGRTYVDPKLVLFSGAVQSACGYAQAAVGPFYCPGDQKVYIGLSFYRDLRDRFHAPGAFAEAYVIAHEVRHHEVLRHFQRGTVVAKQGDFQASRSSSEPTCAGWFASVPSSWTVLNSETRLEVKRRDCPVGASRTG
jgi:predicted metalloprotease